VRVLLVAIAAACSTSSASAPESPPMSRAEYVGPDACGECHPDEHAAWSASLHRAMNARAADDGAVIGDFSGAVVRGAGGEARFDRDARGYTMALARNGAAPVRFRITRTIGRRGLQEYVGVRDDGLAGEEVRLPFGWWPRFGGWAAQPTFDPWVDERAFDAFAAPTEPWAERCPWCHSTYPFALRVARGIGHGLEQRFVDADAPRGKARLDVDQQITIGISCESCHLGGRAHATDRAAMHFVPGSDRPFAVERRDADVVNTVCAQCHSGPSPRLPDGTALRNSSEAIDLAASPCTPARCTDCHDPHAGGSSEPRAIAACVGCHGTPAHADHGSSTCLDCHMPRVVMGIDRFVRTHRISSPNDPRVRASGAPSACDLCHFDRIDSLLGSGKPAFRLVAAHAYARAKGVAALGKLAPLLVDRRAYVRAWTWFAVDEALRQIPQ
jgi:hypothetical protein